MKYGHIELVGDIRDSAGANGLSHADLKNAVDNYHVQNTDTQLDSGVLEVDGSDNVLILQNSINPFQSIASGAVDNTMVLKEGDVGIGTDAPNARLDIRSFENNKVVEIDNDHTDNALYIHQDGALAVNKYSVEIGSGVTQSNQSAIMRVYSNAVDSDDNHRVAYFSGKNPGSVMLIDHNTTPHTTSNHTLLITNSTADVAIDSAVVKFIGNNDSRTEPIFHIDNQTPATGMYLEQSDVLASDKNALYVYSNAVQTNSELVYIHQDNSSSTKNTLKIVNDGTGNGIEVTQNGAGFGCYILNQSTSHALVIMQNGEQSSLNYALMVKGNTINDQINSELIKFWQAHTSTTMPVLVLENDGTGHGQYIQQDGVLATSKHALYVYSNAVQDTSDLAFFHLDNLLSSKDCVSVRNEGSGNILNVIGYSTPMTAEAGLYVISDQAETNSPLALFTLTNAGATTPVLEIDNNGTGYGLYIHQDGVLASDKNALSVYSNANQTNSPLVYFDMNGTGSTQPVLVLENDGTGHGQYIQQDGLLDSNKNALSVYSNAVQTNSALVYFNQDNASSTHLVLAIKNDGNGQAVKIQQIGNGDCLRLDNDGTEHGISLTQDGVLDSNKNALSVYSNTVQTNSWLARIWQDNPSSTAGLLYVDNDGSGTTVYINHGSVEADAGKYGLWVYSNANQTNSPLVYFDMNATGSTQPVLVLDHNGDGAHILFVGDPSNSSPSDGELWFDGTDLKLRVGSTTYTLDKTSV